MENTTQFQYSKKTIAIPIICIFIIWFVYWIEIKFSLNFNKFGIFPRSFSGLKGIFFSPFIHSNTGHLFNNSVPFLVLTSSLLYFHKKVSSKVLIYGTFFTGLLTWTIARPSYHIGASGVIYLLFSFIFFSGILKKHYQLVAVSLIVIFLYGSMVWYMLPIKNEISWEGHLSGFIIGLFYAFIYKNVGITKQPFQFEETEFDLLFDENGQFNPPKKQEENIEDNDANSREKDK